MAGRTVEPLTLWMPGRRAHDLDVDVGGRFQQTRADPPSLGTSGQGAMWAPDKRYLFVARTTTPFIQAFEWIGTGWGATVPNPSTLPGAAPGTALGGQVISVTPDGGAVALIQNTTVGVYCARFFGGATGWGAKYADPASALAGTGRDLAFSPNGKWLAIAHATTPFIAVYPFSIASGFGTKFGNPGTVPSGNSRGVCWSPLSDVVVQCTGIGTPKMAAYPFSLSGFGTKYGNPASLPPALLARGVAFSPNGKWLAVGSITTPFVAVYNWTKASGFGTKWANPASLPPGSALGVFWSPDSQYLAVGSTVTPFFAVYKINPLGSFGAKLTLLTTPASSVVGMAWSRDASLALAIGVSPGLNAWL